MKKDKFIQKKLNEYADSIKPPCFIIEDAANIVKSNAAYRKYTLPKYSFIKAFSAAAAAIAVFICAILLINNIGSTDVPNYSIAALGRNSIELSDIKDINEKILVIEEYNMSVECYAFFDRASYDTVTIYAKYKIIGEKGVDEVYILADINKGLIGYEDFKSYNKRQINKTDVCFKESYLNGEYYTKAYFNIDNIDYYVIVMSSEFGRGYYHLEKLL